MKKIYSRCKLDPKFIIRRFAKLVESLLEMNPSAFIERIKNGSITFNYDGKLYVVILSGGYQTSSDGLGRIEYAVSLYQENNSTFIDNTYWYDHSLLDFINLTTFDRNRIDLWFARTILPEIKNIITNEV